jgi:hypothetical protein
MERRPLNSGKRAGHKKTTKKRTVTKTKTKLKSKTRVSRSLDQTGTMGAIKPQRRSSQNKRSSQDGERRERPGLRRPPAKNNSMAIVIGVSAVVMLIAIIAIATHSTPPQERVGGNSYSKTKMEIDKLYKKLDAGYIKFARDTDGGDNNFNGAVAEANRLKKICRKLLDTCTNYLDTGSPSRSERLEVLSWQEGAQKIKRQLGTFLFKNS